MLMANRFFLPFLQVLDGMLRFFSLQTSTSFRDMFENLFWVATQILLIVMHLHLREIFLIIKTAFVAVVRPQRPFHAVWCCEAKWTIIGPVVVRYWNWLKTFEEVVEFSRALEGWLVFDDMTRLAYFDDFQCVGKIFTFLNHREWLDGGKGPLNFWALESHRWSRKSLMFNWDLPD